MDLAGIEPLLTFWFGAVSDGFADDAHRRRWFSPDPGFDDECRSRFGDLCCAAIAGECSHWLETPRGRLACILACDQMPRNIHRGTREAFAGDHRALQIARDGILSGADQLLTYDERAFFYMPFEHSENRVDQHTCVGLFTQLRDSTPPGKRHLTGNYLRFAQQHRDLLQRFGRFPHRNALLGRTSSTEELDYLKTGTDFGQAAH